MRQFVGIYRSSMRHLEKNGSRKWIIKYLIAYVSSFLQKVPRSPTAPGASQKMSSNSTQGPSRCVGDECTSLPKTLCGYAVKQPGDAVSHPTAQGGAAVGIQ